MIVARNILWSATSLLLFILCVVVLGGSIMLVGVLREIGEKNFNGPMERINSYEQFFASVSKAGYDVTADKPNLHEGVTTYLWTVQPKGSDDPVVFRWQHDFATNIVTPMSNGALLTDIALGYIKRDEASQAPFYDPKDAASNLILATGRGMNPGQLTEAGWSDNPDTAAPAPDPLPPILSPEDASRRRGGTTEEEPENPCGTEAGGPEDLPPGDSTEIQPPTDGEGTEVGGGETGGEENGGGGGVSGGPGSGEESEGGESGGSGETGGSGEGKDDSVTVG